MADAGWAGPDVELSSRGFVHWLGFRQNRTDYPPEVRFRGTTSYARHAQNDEADPPQCPFVQHAAAAVGHLSRGAGFGSCFSAPILRPLRAAYLTGRGVGAVMRLLFIGAPSCWCLASSANAWGACSGRPSSAPWLVREAGEGRPPGLLLYADPQIVEVRGLAAAGAPQVDAEAAGRAGGGRHGHGFAYFFPGAVGCAHAG